MTQLEYAKKGKITPLMRRVAKAESLSPEIIREGIAKGAIVIPSNITRSIKRPCGIGAKLRTKVNANIGTSPDSASLPNEIKKLTVALRAGADTVMDLSTGGNLPKIRQAILKRSSVPVGTVPIYEAAVNITKERRNFSSIRANEIFSVIERQAEEGVDFFTIHAGITMAAVERLKKQGRLLDIVSRGGALLAQWMCFNQRENPLYEYFDRLLEIAKKYDVTLSLGDGMRPGSLADATDRAQIQELVTLGELVKRGRANGVQTIVEGPGHLPIDQIESNILLAKSLCNGAPFYVLGPLVTDIAPGYDHITGAIGGAIAAWHGADFLCYVTASEHLRLPSIHDVEEGVITSRIAAHAADIAKGIKGASNWDAKLSLARKKRDWNKLISLAIDPVKSKRLSRLSRISANRVCTMCGDYCSIKLSESIK